jgi:UDPglucose--hexose-1-phosphate uridylyltransferase
MIHCAEYVKPDGHRLWLYGRRPPNPLGPVPSPFSTAVSVDTHLRFHPLLREWVIYASHRQERTFLPPASSDPLAPTRDPGSPTELPAGDYEVAVFENRFPSLVSEAGLAPVVEGAETAAAVGHARLSSSRRTRAKASANCRRIASLWYWMSGPSAPEPWRGPGWLMCCRSKTAAPRWV